MPYPALQALFDDLIPAGPQWYWRGDFFGGGYVNFPDGGGRQRVQAAYRGSYARLARVKAKYDPDNVFHGRRMS